MSTNKQNARRHLRRILQRIKGQITVIIMREKERERMRERGDREREREGERERERERVCVSWK